MNYTSLIHYYLVSGFVAAAALLPLKEEMCPTLSSRYLKPPQYV